MDQVISDLDTRFQTTANIVEEFAAILKIGKLSDGVMASVCQPLREKYSQDLTDHFESEIRHLNTICSATFPPECSSLDRLNAATFPPECSSLDRLNAATFPPECSSLDRLNAATSPLIAALLID
ncbi:hypothetical protein KUCAC02_033388 [Chaenocephalus aceratus]|nr:hypothetical protein KUCAC02_033388 [Chaenocephalus aceratus]